MQTLQVRFEPFDWTDSMGTLVFEPVEISAKNIIKNGYFLLHPYHFDQVTDPLYDAEQNKDKWRSMRSLDGARYVSDWWQNALDYLPNKHTNTMYGQVLQSELQKYNTVVFPHQLPLSVSEIIRFTSAKNTVVIRKDTKYEDIVELAIRRMSDPKIWTQKFIQKLIYRIGTGLEDDSIIADLSEVRGVMKELRPEIKLKGWADFRALDLPNLFSPQDFREMEDVIVSVILDEKIIEYEAFLQACTKETPDIPGNYYLRCDILHLGNNSTWNTWSVKLGGTSGDWWKIASAEGEIVLEPEVGRTMTMIRTSMRDDGLDIKRTIPYHMSWEEFEVQLSVLHPRDTSTGVQIICDNNLPNVIKFKGISCFRDLTVDTMRKICQSYGLEKGKDKTDTWNNIMDLLVHEYPNFDKIMRESLEGLQLIRVTNFERNPPDEHKDNKNRVFDLQDIVAKEFEHPILLQYMLSIFMLAHCYSGIIIRPEYVTTLFTLEGILESFKEVGYIGQDGNSTFYFMTNKCALPKKLPSNVLAPIADNNQFNKLVTLNVSGADQLIADILGD